MRTPFQARWIDRYYLCEELATGGMATVYGALYVGPGGFQKPCAVKLMHPHLSHDDGFVQMFEDEARVAACIDHPNVCRVTDYGVRDGDTYIVMELLDGQNFWTLFQRLIARPELRENPEFPLVLARLALDVAEGLHAAHEARGLDGAPLQVVHRDISLSNLFLSRDGTVRVVDFGVVKSVGRVHHTATGCFKGKLAYLAPEYLLTGKIDRRADVFALGVVLWEMLAGRRLHGGLNEVEIFRSVMSNKSAPLRDLCPWLPPALGAIVDRAMSLDPDERYLTARSMAEDLGRFLVTSGRLVTPGEISMWLARVAPVGPPPVRALLAQQTSALPKVSPEGHRVLPPPLPLAPTGVPRFTVPIQDPAPPALLPSPFVARAVAVAAVSGTAETASGLVQVPTIPAQPQEEASVVQSLSLADVQLSMTPPVIRIADLGPQPTPPILRAEMDTLVDPVHTPVTLPRAALASTLAGLGVPASLLSVPCSNDESDSLAVGEPRAAGLSLTLRGLGPSDPPLSPLDTVASTEHGLHTADTNPLAAVPPPLLGSGLMSGALLAPRTNPDEPTLTAYPVTVGAVGAVGAAPLASGPANEGRSPSIADSEEGPSTSQLLPLVHGEVAADASGAPAEPTAPVNTAAMMEPSAVFQLAPAMLLSLPTMKTSEPAAGEPVAGEPALEAPLFETPAVEGSLGALAVPTEPLFSVPPPASSTPSSPSQPLGPSSLDIDQTSAGLTVGPGLGARWLRPVQGLAVAAAMATLGLFARHALVHDSQATTSTTPATRLERHAPATTPAALAPVAPVVAVAASASEPSAAPPASTGTPDTATPAASVPAVAEPVASAAPSADRAARTARRDEVTEEPAPMDAPDNAPAATPAPSASVASAEARPAPGAVTGRVMLSTPGGSADVFFQGRSLGATPLTITLPVGPQTIELRTPDLSSPQPVGVTVQEGRTVLFSVPIAQLVP